MKKVKTLPGTDKIEAEVKRAGEGTGTEYQLWFDSLKADYKQACEAGMESKAGFLFAFGSLANIIAAEHQGKQH